jgi:pilus assembly protein CpaE
MRALRRRVALITHLTVPHIQQVKRQLRTMTELQIDTTAALIVCNAISSSQLSSISVKAAERALGREFDMVIPEDGRTMTAALNQGVEISSIRRGTKLEKAIEAFAGRLTADAGAPKAAAR